MHIMDRHLDIVRVKERLGKRNRTSEGWGDVLINFRVTVDEDGVLYSHICEVRLRYKYPGKTVLTLEMFEPQDYATFL